MHRRRDVHPERQRGVSRHRGTAKQVPQAVARAVRDHYGYEVPVVVRSAQQLREVAVSHPFLAEGVAAKLLHVAFLADTPREGAALDPDRSPGDRFELHGRHLYLYYPNGTARSKLDNAYVDRALGTVSTMRNWNTVQALAARFSGNATK